ncbi:hypothetical protein [Pseudoalteromonas sp. SR45-4]|uniref:hypothetical protein n=1 Tax=Pseudoalteromonas sp. SR45-4 TaxID=2760929 RepID=UPI0015FCF49E|nr:hypothetical protein [Pseudoalteromonas sp. SR45-4]MBB1371245.1 hypothetical protein [Pseudoalteromonas sp. SR45-4]
MSSTELSFDLEKVIQPPNAAIPIYAHVKVINGELKSTMAFTRYEDFLDQQIINKIVMPNRQMKEVANNYIDTDLSEFMDNLFIQFNHAMYENFYYFRPLQAGSIMLSTWYEKNKDKPPHKVSEFIYNFSLECSKLNWRISLKEQPKAF